MLPLITWLALIALGPGSIAIFVWFLWDLRRILRRDDGRSSGGPPKAGTC